jgi:hypothetical protein
MAIISKEIVEKTVEIAKILSNSRIFLFKIEKENNCFVYIGGIDHSPIRGNTHAFAYYCGVIQYISDHSDTISNDAIAMLDLYKDIANRSGAPKYHRKGYEYAESVLLDLGKHLTICDHSITDIKEREDRKEMLKFKGTIALLLSSGLFIGVSFVLLSLFLLGGLFIGTWIVFVELMQGL